MVRITRAAHSSRHDSFVMLLLLLLGIAGAPSVASASQGQNPPPQDIMFSVSGRITERSAGTLTVDSGQNMLFTVKYDSSTKIQHKDGSAAKASELRVGTRILAKGVLTQAGDVIAKLIEIESGPKRQTRRE